jgi:N-acetylglucosamine-6-phosphate deacetylase
MSALNAARLLKLDDKIGSIEVGKQANLIVFDDDLRSIRTFHAGCEIRSER